MPPIPPPWFPPLESLFRGAPIPRNAQRGKPILLHRKFGSSVEPLLGERRKPLRGLPFGSRPLQFFIFTLAGGKVGRGLPLVAVWPVGPRPGGDDRVRWFWISWPFEGVGLKAKSLLVFPPPTQPQSRLGEKPSVDLWPHPPPRGAPRQTGKQQVKEEGAREEKARPSFVGRVVGWRE